MSTTCAQPWASISFSDSGRDRLDEVMAFLDDLEQQEHPLAAMARAEFTERMNYLNDFGGAVSDVDDRRRFRVTLLADWAPLSFGITWYRLNRETGEYLFAFRGGLIFHGGSNDPLCVSVTPCIFGIHT